MIKLSTKGRYATRIMVYLATCDNSTPVRKQAIANAEQISSDYVEQILVKLRTAGLVTSHRGVKGGFSLSRNPYTISVANVLNATEGPTQLVPCAEEGCERITMCVTRTVWEKADTALKRIFDSIKIGQLAEEVKNLSASKPLSFEI